MKAWMWSVFVLGCAGDPMLEGGEADAELSATVGEVAPPSYILGATALVPGRQATISVFGPPPRANVRLAVSSTGEGTGPCAPNGTCLGVLGPVNFFPMTHQPNGSYALVGTLPPMTGERWMQAVITAGGTLSTTDVVYRVIGDGDVDFQLPPEDCDDADNTVYAGAPELADNVDNDCDGSVDEVEVNPGWVDAGAVYQLDITQETYSVDCPPNPFGSGVQVNGVDFATYGNGNILGLAGGTEVSPPTADGAWDNAYMLMTGGRCADETLSVTWSYQDGSATGVSLVVPWDCAHTDVTAVPNGDGDFAGLLGVGGCCDGWYWLAFSNPTGGAVSSLKMDYADACGGVYPGQIWALSAD